MKKQEFIKRYGEEAYQRKLEKDRQHQKQYYNTHKEEKKQYEKQYRDTHRDEIKRYNKQYKDTHKDELMRYDKQYKKEYKKTQIGRAVNLAGQYNHKDKEKGFDISNNIDSSYIVKRIFSSKCIYCGDDNWEHLGCDRIDNSKPHTPDNVVPCCGICNAERSDSKTVEEMLEYRTTNPRVLRNRNAQIEKTPSGAIKKRVFTVTG